MKCLLCGKPLSKIRLRSEGDFCCREHRERYRLMQGMNRVREANEAATITRRRERPIPIPLQPASSAGLEQPRACLPGAPVTRREVREYPCPPMRVMGSIRLPAASSAPGRPAARQVSAVVRQDAVSALAMRSGVVLPRREGKLKPAADGKPARAGVARVRPPIGGRVSRRHDPPATRVRREPVLPRRHPARSGRLRAAQAAPVRGALGPAFSPASPRGVTPVWYRERQTLRAASLPVTTHGVVRSAAPGRAGFEVCENKPVAPAEGMRREVLPPLPSPRLVTGTAFTGARVSIGALPLCALAAVAPPCPGAAAARREGPAAPFRIISTGAVHDLHVPIRLGSGALEGGGLMRTKVAILGRRASVPAAASLNMPAHDPLTPAFAITRNRPALREGPSANIRPSMRLPGLPGRRSPAPRSAAERLTNNVAGPQRPPATLAHVPPEMVAPPHALACSLIEAPRIFRADEAPFVVRAAVLAPAMFAVQGNVTGVVDPGAAAVSLEESFDSGLSRWAGAVADWHVDFAGVRIGSLALFGPSLGLRDYQAEFVAKIDKRSVCCVLRASDLNNYYVVKIAMAGKTHAAGYELSRYAVRNGVPEPPVTVPLRIAIRSKAVFRVQARVAGDQFSLSVEDEPAAQWSESALPYGGIGFFADAGDPARLYRLKLESLAGSAVPGRGGISNVEH